MSEQDRLAQAVELVKAGNHAEAQKIVAEVIRADKSNARAWILMAKIVDDPDKALQCWQEVARLKPDDTRVQEEIAKLKGEPAPQASPPEQPFSAKSFQPPSAQPIRPSSTPTDQPISTQPVQLIAPAEQKKKIPLPLLIGGGATIVVVVCCVALVIASMTTQSDPNHQATSTARAATTIAEKNRPTNVPALAVSTIASVAVGPTEAPKSVEPTIVPTAASTTVPTAAPQRGLARTDPLPAGQSISSGPFTFTVGKVTHPADTIIAEGNMFNSTPEPGNEFVMFDLTVACSATGDDKCNLGISIEFKLTGDKGLVYEPKTLISGVPGLLESIEMFGGASTTGGLVFEVGQGEANLVLMYEPFLSFDPDVYLSIP